MAVPEEDLPRAGSKHSLPYVYFLFLRCSRARALRCWRDVPGEGLLGEGGFEGTPRG